MKNTIHAKKLLKISAVAANFFLEGQQKSKKCSKRSYIFDAHKEWRWKFLKLVFCFWVLLFFRNRSIVDFCGWRGWDGQKIVDGGGGRAIKVWMEWVGGS